MKKILFMILSVLLFVGVAEAEECILVNGTEKKPGAEVVCGTEHFYIISNDGTNVKMMAKYNLDAGFVLNEKTITNEELNALGKSRYDWCSEDAYYDEFFNLYYIMSSFGTVEGANCVYGQPVPSTVVKQNSKAIGAYGTNPTHPDFPQYGVVQLQRHDQYETYYNAYGGGYYHNGKKIFEYSSEEPNVIDYYLKKYKEYLGDPITNVDLIGLDELSAFAKAVGGTELPLEEWYNAQSTNNNIIDTTTGQFRKEGSLKEHLPKGYEWIYSTSYWTKTFDVNDSFRIYFVDTLGYVCSTNVCEMLIGNGIRPVVTIPADKITYRIQIKTDGHGDIKIEKIEAEGGELIKFTIEPEKGYVLGTLLVTDSNGNTIEVEGNTFTMPNDNVLIEATFVVANAKTSDIGITVGVILVISLSMVLFSYLKQKKLN